MFGRCNAIIQGPICRLTDWFSLRRKGSPKAPPFASILLEKIKHDGVYGHRRPSNCSEKSITNRQTSTLLGQAIDRSHVLPPREAGTGLCDPCMFYILPALCTSSFLNPRCSYILSKCVSFLNVIRNSQWRKRRRMNGSLKFVLTTQDGASRVSRSSCQFYSWHHSFLLMERQNSREGVQRDQLSSL